MVLAAAVYIRILIHLTPTYVHAYTYLITAHHRYQSVHIHPIKDCKVDRRDRILLVSSSIGLGLAANENTSPQTHTRTHTHTHTL